MTMTDSIGTLAREGRGVKDLSLSLWRRFKSTNRAVNYTFRPAFDLYDLGSFGMIVLSLSVAICAGAQRVAPTAIAVIAAMTAASLAIGRAGLRLPIGTYRFLAEYLLGFISVSLIILAGCYIGSFSVILPAGVVAALGLAAAAHCAVRGRVGPAGKPADLLVCGIVCLASVIWSWQAIIATSNLAESGVFTAWSDYFIHSGEIAQFVHFGALRGSSIFAAGAPLPFYHYGSYMPAAAVSAASGIPAIVAATACWTPLGFILLGFGAGVLGSVMKGPIGGILAIGAVLLMPDAAHYGLQNPFFDFHWLLQVSSSGTYAVALACFAIAATVIWLRTHNRESLVWAIAASLMAFAFRVQVFVPLAMTQSVFILFAWRPSRRWHRPTVVATVIGIVLLAAMLSEQIDRAPHLMTGPHHPIRSLLLLHGMQPSQYEEFYAIIVAHAWPPAALAIGLIMLIPAAFGALFPLYFCGLAWRVRGGMSAAEDWFPLVAISSYIALVALFPTPPREQLEFAHRPFVFVYAILAIWCSSFAAAILRSWLQDHKGLMITSVAAITLLVVPLKLGRQAQSSMLSWGKEASTIPLPRGLMEAAAFERVHAAPSDVVATNGSPWEDAFLALSERATFFPGTEFMLIQSGISTEGADERRKQRDAILQAVTPEAARRAAACAGIDWLVILPPNPPLGSLSEEAVLEMDGASVYRFRNKIKCEHP